MRESGCKLRGFFEWLGWRRSITGFFLVVLLTGIVTASDTWIVSPPSAQAGNCANHSATWKLRSGTVGPTIGRVHFGATICTENGRVTGVSPYLNGGIEGAGTPAGFIFTSLGVWTVRSTGTYVEVHGQSQVKDCIPGARGVVCSLTDTEDYTLRYYSTDGPYSIGTEPGVFPQSRTCHLGGGCAPEVTFIRI